MQRDISCGIGIVYGIIVAVRKHVIAQEALSGGGEGIGGIETAQAGVVIPGLEVVELKFRVIDIATVAQGGILANGIGVCAGDRQDIAPGIVSVGNNSIPTTVKDSKNIPLLLHLLNHFKRFANPSSNSSRILPFTDKETIGITYPSPKYCGAVIKETSLPIFRMPSIPFSLAILQLSPTILKQVSSNTGAVEEKSM
jgi:hypothetical protein